MAEAIARKKMTDIGNISFESAGTSALDGQQASLQAVSVLSEMGIDLSSHRAAALTQNKISNSDFIVAMTSRHKLAVLNLDPNAEPRVIVLGELDAGRKTPDIKDPIGGNREVYIGVRDDIDYLINMLKDYLVERFDLGGDNAG